MCVLLCWRFVVLVCLTFWHVAVLNVWNKQQCKLELLKCWISATLKFWNFELWNFESLKVKHKQQYQQKQYMDAPIFWTLDKHEYNTWTIKTLMVCSIFVSKNCRNTKRCNTQMNLNMLNNRQQHYNCVFNSCSLCCTDDVHFMLILTKTKMKQIQPLKNDNLEI